MDSEPDCELVERLLCALALVNLKRVRLCLCLAVYDRGQSLYPELLANFLVRLVVAVHRRDAHGEIVALDVVSRCGVVRLQTLALPAPRGVKLDDDGGGVLESGLDVPNVKLQDGRVRVERRFGLRFLPGAPRGAPLPGAGIAPGPAPAVLAAVVIIV